MLSVLRWTSISFNSIDKRTLQLVRQTTVPCDASNSTLCSAFIALSNISNAIILSFRCEPCTFITFYFITQVAVAFNPILSEFRISVFWQEPVKKKLFRRRRKKRIFATQVHLHSFLGDFANVHCGGVYLRVYTFLFGNFNLRTTATRPMKFAMYDMHYKFTFRVVFCFTSPNLKEVTGIYKTKKTGMHFPSIVWKKMNILLGICISGQTSWNMEAFPYTFYFLPTDCEIYYPNDRTDRVKSAYLVSSSNMHLLRFYFMSCYATDWSLRWVTKIRIYFFLKIGAHW